MNLYYIYLSYLHKTLPNTRGLKGMRIIYDVNIQVSIYVACIANTNDGNKKQNYQLRVSIKIPRKRLK